MLNNIMTKEIQESEDPMVEALIDLHLVKNTDK